MGSVRPSGGPAQGWGGARGGWGGKRRRHFVAGCAGRGSKGRLAEAPPSRCRPDALGPLSALSLGFPLPAVGLTLWAKKSLQSSGVEEG